MLWVAVFLLFFYLWVRLSVLASMVAEHTMCSMTRYVEVDLPIFGCHFPFYGVIDRYAGGWFAIFWGVISRFIVWLSVFGGWFTIIFGVNIYFCACLQFSLLWFPVYVDYPFLGMIGRFLAYNYLFLGVFAVFWGKHTQKYVLRIFSWGKLAVCYEWVKRMKFMSAVL